MSFYINAVIGKESNKADKSYSARTPTQARDRLPRVSRRRTIDAATVTKGGAAVLQTVKDRSSKPSLRFPQEYKPLPWYGQNACALKERALKSAGIHTVASFNREDAYASKARFAGLNPAATLKKR